jgi:hypothetical protein
VNFSDPFSCLSGSFPPVDDIFAQRTDLTTNPNGSIVAVLDSRPQTLAPMMSGLGFFTPDGQQAANPPRKLSKVQNIDFAFDTTYVYSCICDIVRFDTAIDPLVMAHSILTELRIR